MSEGCDGSLDCLWKVILEKTAAEDRAIGLATDLLPLCIVLPLVEIDLSKEADGLVRASDASGQGRGEASSSGLTQRGGIQLREIRCPAKHPPVDASLLVELCAAIRTATRAMEILEVRPAAQQPT